MGEEFNDDGVSAESMANAVSTDPDLKDKFDGSLTRAYVREILEYDRNAAAIRMSSIDNKSGRRSAKKKYEAEGLDTDAVEKVLKAYRIIRSSGVPEDKLTRVFKSVEGAVGGKLIEADEDEPVQEED